MTQKITVHKIDFRRSAERGKYLLNHYLSIDYNRLNIDLLNTDGNKLDLVFFHNYVSDTCIEIEFLEEISGVFQLRMQDGINFFIKKIIIY